MANIIAVPTLECIAGCFFTITPEVVTANTPFSPVCSNLSLFYDAKRGKMKLTMFFFKTYVTLNFLKLFFDFACFCVTYMIGSN